MTLEQCRSAVGGVAWYVTVCGSAPVWVLGVRELAKVWRLDSGQVMSLPYAWLELLPRAGGPFP